MRHLEKDGEADGACVGTDVARGNEGTLVGIANGAEVVVCIFDEKL